MRVARAVHKMNLPAKVGLRNTRMPPMTARIVTKYSFRMIMYR